MEHSTLKRSREEKTETPKKISKSSKGSSKKVFEDAKISITGNLDRDSLSKLIIKHGGVISPIVSKKISFLVATETAVKENTQRIRKAQKFGKIVVSEEFIHESIKAKRLLDLDDYILKDFSKQPKDSTNEEDEIQTVKSSQLK